MITLKRLNRKSSIPLPLGRPAPAPYFDPLFKNFQSFPTPGEVIEIYPFKMGGLRVSEL